MREPKEQDHQENQKIVPAVVMDRQSQTNISRSYVDLDPPTNWVRDQEGLDTLVIDLPESFRKEHVKVMVDNLGNLRISGECPVSENKWARFNKNFHLPSESIASDIRAKLFNGKVYVKMPKKFTEATSNDQQLTSKQQSITAPKSATQQVTAGADVGAIESTKEPAFGRQLVSGLKANKRLLVGVAAVTITAVVALEIYKAYKLRSLPSD